MWTISWRVQDCPWEVSLLHFAGQWKVQHSLVSSQQHQTRVSSWNQRHNISAQIVLMVRAGTHSFHHLRSLKADWKAHLYVSNWPKPSGMHSSTSLSRSLSFLTPTMFQKTSSPAPPLPTCCLPSQLCRALSSAVSREGSPSSASCMLLERTPHHSRSAARQAWVIFF